MCGFVGIVTNDSGANIDVPSIERSLDMVAHRGPDDRRTVSGRGYAFGHVRLSILDLSNRAAQPMQSGSRRWTLVYNGQVFNHLELKKELAALGHMLISRSDTEVVLHCLIEWGSACLARLNGQFALAFYDGVERRLLLARDRMGIKPLYYWQGRDSLLFASEPKAIFTHPLFTRRLNLHAVSSFLSYRQVVGNHTYFEGLNELAPASVLEFHDGGVTRRRYWSLGARGTRREIDLTEIRSCIRGAVATQLVADVPVALFLSGGLDSSILAAEASRADPSVAAFTASITDDASDEAGAAERAAAHFGLAHVRVPVTRESHLCHLEALIRRKGLPLGMHNEIEMYLLSKAVAQRAKVVLCGEGADELFAGYGRIFRLPFETLGRRLLAFPRGGAVSFDLFYERYTYFPEQEKQALFDSAVWRELAGGGTARETLKDTFFEVPGLSFFDRIWCVFVKLHLRGLLAMVDAMTMAAGVEARVPFLDPLVVDVAHALPERDKLRWQKPWNRLRALGRPAAEFSERLDTPKFALRQAYRDVLPREVLARRKAGFPVPLTRWYGDNAGAYPRSILFAKGARLVELMRRPAIEAFIERAAQRRDEASGRQMFQLVSLELFLRHHM
ncbi:MAG TPA: asparagine synthase (glutamine-hydrolyzing) [Thermoanaerobaculia bacterium]|jgi:asparagine synthase (glutamine-hydrolysing)|nr:asparagine synthase (glutamine-hydrolyzing) [Thermoanaerobaculia bacterium]